MAKQKEPISMPRAFLEGLARIFDPFSSVERGFYRRPYEKTVSKQFQRDWETIGHDAKVAFGKFQRQEK